MGRFQYIPSLGGGFIEPKIWKRLKHGDKTLTWWRDDSIIKVDGMLISYPYAREAGLLTNFRETFGVRKDVLLLADSGGYEVVMKGLNINPEEVINWQTANDFDVGFVLDVPFFKRDITEKVPSKAKYLKFDKNEIINCAKRTKNNTEVMYRLLDRSKTNMKVYGVVHGLTLEQMELWKKYAMEGLEFDGVGLGVMSTDLDTVVDGIIFAYENGFKRIHAFQGSGNATIPILIYASKYFDLVTVDSTRYLRSGAAYKMFEMPAYKMRLLAGRKKKKHGIGDYATHPCHCPVCQVAIEKYGENFLNRELGSFEEGALLALHNLYVWMEHFNFMLSIRDNYEIFSQLIKRYSRRVKVHIGAREGHFETIKAIEKLRRFFEEGERPVGRLDKWLI